MRRFVSLFMALVLPAAPAAAQECRLDFTVEVTQGAGDIRPGRILSGQATFQTTGEDFRGEAGITVHRATGEMTIGAGIRGDLWALVTTSGNPVADLLAVHARNVEGFTVAGLRYAGPMTITLYARPGSLPDATVPTEQAAWDAMDLRRRFALHAQGYDRVAGDVTGLGVDCD
jgi:hypothetical protein